MIKQFFKFSTLSLLVLLVFSSCSDSDNPVEVPKGDYEDGYFISNEGNFGSPNASVSFIDNDFMKIDQKVFQNVNGTPLGDVLQSITIDGGLIYLIVNNSNKIEVVDRTTFQSVATLTTNLKLPRFAVVENEKLYVSNSGKKSLEVFDIVNFDHVTTIDIDRTIDEVKKDNGFLYVMNTSNRIIVINANTNTIETTIEVGNGLKSIEIEDGILYALHKTGITKVATSNNAIIGEIPFEEGLKNASKLEIEDNNIYFISGSKIFKYNTDVTVLSNTELVDTEVSDGPFTIGYGFSVVGEKIFYTDVKGFTENSEVLVYDLEGKFLKSFTAGMGANGVYGSN